MLLELKEDGAWSIHIVKSFKEICELIPQADFAKDSSPYFMEVLTGKAPDVDISELRILILMDENSINNAYIVTYNIASELICSVFDVMNQKEFNF